MRLVVSDGDATRRPYRSMIVKAKRHARCLRLGAASAQGLGATVQLRLQQAIELARKVD